MFPRRITRTTKPSIAKLDYSNHIARKIGRGDVWSPTSNNALIGLNSNKLTYEGSSSLVASSKGQGFLGTLGTSDGVSIPSTQLSSDGWSELSFFALTYYSGSSGAERPLFREATAANRGVTLAFIASTELRGLVYTTGTSIWTAGQDSTIDTTAGWYLFGMVFDGSTRKMYQAPLGRAATELRSDACTGTINIENEATAEFWLQGGANTVVTGHDGPQILTALFDEALNKAEIDSFCKNPYQILQPITQYIPTFVPAVGGVTVPVFNQHYRNQGIM